MVFTFRIWRLKITLALFDLNPSDGDIAFSVTISWK